MVITRSSLQALTYVWCFRTLQIKLDQPVSDPASPRDINNGDTAANLSSHIQNLRSEVVRLKNQLSCSQQEREYQTPQ